MTSEKAGKRLTAAAFGAAFAVAVLFSMGQTNPGTSPTSIAKGGTGATTASGARTNLGLAIGTNVQAYDADLACLAGLSSTGLFVRTGSGTCVVRTLTAPAAGITVSNGDGVSGNPTLALANDLAALEALSSTGCVARSAAETWSLRTITGTGNEITVSNGDCVGGNPTLSLSSTLQLNSKTITVADANFTFQDNADATKQARLQLSGITAGQTREYTLPDASTTVVGTDTTQTLSGKTLAAPIMTGVSDVQGQPRVSSFVTATQITSNQNNYTATDGSNTCTTKRVLRLSADAARDITGLSCSQADGDLFYVYNRDAQTITLKDESGSSSAANRFALGADVALATKQGITLIYDGTAQRYRPVSGSGSGGGGGGGVTSVACADGVFCSTITSTGTIRLELHPFMTASGN